MKKQTIKLNESQLIGIIKEGIKNILMEIGGELSPEPHEGDYNHRDFILRKYTPETIKWWEAKHPEYGPEEIHKAIIDYKKTKYPYKHEEFAEVQDKLDNGVSIDKITRSMGKPNYYGNCIISYNGRKNVYNMYSNKILSPNQWFDSIEFSGNDFRVEFEGQVGILTNDGKLYGL